MGMRIIGPEGRTAEADGASALLHGSCVCIEPPPAAVLMIGPSGAGKSALALQLTAIGCALVADDGVCIRRRGGALIATAPETIRGRIEARGVGILCVPFVQQAPLRLVIDMGQAETGRLPQARRCRILGVELPLLHKVGSAHFPAAIRHYLKGGRTD